MSSEKPTTNNNKPSEEPLEEPSEESFEALFEASMQKGDMKEGDIVTGRVIHVGDENCVVDIGYKSEGEIPLNEFRDRSGNVQVKEGDEIEVLMVSREDADGLVVLSKEKADKLKVWDEISAACERDELIEGTISQRVKGGLSVHIEGGVKAFLPGSQVDLRPVRNLDVYLGKTYKFKVIKFNKKRGNIVLSRRVLLEQERADMKAKVLSTLEEGKLVEGTVKNLTEYGAFIDLGGIDGLLHITDMSWGRVNHPSEIFKVGDTAEVKVLKYNSDTERVSLGLKQITDNPWKTAEERYVPGTVVKGRVVSIKDYGAFIELEEGIEGLIHVSEMSWTRRIKHPSKVLEVGDTVEAVVLDIDASSNRISLGMKQLEPNPYEALREKYPPDTMVKGKIRNIADFGVFVEIEDGIDGLVHISDLSWTQRVRHPSELYQKGEEVEAVVLDIEFDQDKPKISLGMKQAVPNPWERIPADYPPGKLLEVKVRKVLDYGAFVEIEQGIDGFVHVSEMSEERIDDPRKFLTPGQKVLGEIIAVDVEDRKIALSLKAAQRSEELADIQGFGGVSGVQATLGDVLKEKLSDMVPGSKTEDTPKESKEETEPEGDEEKAKAEGDEDEAKAEGDEEKAKAEGDEEKAKAEGDEEKAKAEGDEEKAKAEGDEEKAKAEGDEEKA